MTDEVVSKNIIDFAVEGNMLVRERENEREREGVCERERERERLCAGVFARESRLPCTECGC